LLRSETWSPRRSASRREGRRLLCISLACSLLSVVCAGVGVAALGPRSDEPRRLPSSDTGPRTLIIALPGVTWADLRQADLPNLHRLMDSGAVGLMPVASASDEDPNRTWATLSAGRGAVAGRRLGEVWSGGEVQLDLGPVRGANAADRTGAEVGLFGDLLSSCGLSRAVVAWNVEASDPLYRLGLLVLADESGRVDSGQAIAGPRYTPEVERALEDAILHHNIALLVLGKGADIDAEPRENSQHLLHEALSRADEVVGAALVLLRGHKALVVVVSPVAPRQQGENTRNLGPVIIYDTGGELGRGVLSSPTTRWPGIVSPADVAPTVLDWWDIWELNGRGPEEHAITAALCPKMQGRPMQVVAAADALSRLDRLAPLLTDRYRLRVVVAKWYIGYGLLVVVLGLAVGFTRPGRVRMAAGPALALALIPAGLAVAALVPPGRDAIHLAVTGMVAAALAFVGTRSRKPERGLAAALLIAAALIAGDTVSGSWLMRRSAFEMGVMNGLRFYGISNDFMGCLVGMAVVGAAALAQFGPRGGRAAAVIGAAVVLAIGAPFWGANWGGAVTAAAGFASLWLLTRERIRLRHVGLAVAMLAAGALAPAGLDLLQPEPARSHIGASAAALLAGRTGELGDVVVRKLLQNYGVLRQAPWSPFALVLCAGVFWALLRPGGPGRRALAGKRWIAAGIWASVIAGIVAMVVNDSGVAAGFGCILAALGAAIFVAARPEEVAA